MFLSLWLVFMFWFRVVFPSKIVENNSSIKGCFVWGSRTSLLHHILSWAIVEILETDRQQCWFGKPLNWGNPSQFMTWRSHTPISHNEKNGFFKLVPHGAHWFMGNLVTECIILMSVIGRLSWVSVSPHFFNNCVSSLYDNNSATL